MKVEQTILTLSQAARYLQLTPTALMQWVVLGKLPVAALDNNMRFHRDHLDHYLKEMAERNCEAMKSWPVELADAVDLARQHHNGEKAH
jgi:excisionase family DNA binding protein